MRTAVGRSVARKLCSDARTHGKWNERASPVTQTPTRATDASAISVTQRGFCGAPPAPVKRLRNTCNEWVKDVWHALWEHLTSEWYGAVTNT